MSTPAITVRHPRFDLDDLPVAWIAGSRLATAYGNAGHVFIPVGEEFFIDTVRAAREHLHDPDLRSQVNAFIGQEAVHRRAHEALWGLLRSRGLPVDAYAGWIRQVRSLERYVPLPLRLATTAALEHYTAAFGAAFLTEDLAEAVPQEMARLLAWHGLEELEHRAVAFDVLAELDDRYAIRLAGFAIATAMLAVVPAVGTVAFLVAGGPTPPEATTTGARELRGMVGRFTRRMGAHVLDYVRPGFHPRDLVEPPEAEAWAAQLDTA